MNYRTFRAVSLSCLILLVSGIYWLTPRSSGALYPLTGLPASAIRTTAGDAELSVYDAPRRSSAVSAPPGGQYAARAQFEQGVAARPDNPIPLLQLADEIATRDTAAGITAFRQLTEAYPESVAAWAGLSAVHAEADNIEESRAVLNRVFQLDTENGPGRVLSGRLYAQASPPRLREALQEWRRVLEHSAGTPEAAEALRLIQLYEGR